MITQSELEAAGYRRGTITGFYGSWDSGLARLEVDGIQFPCDNSITVKSLDAAFGDFITRVGAFCPPDHCVDPSAVIGKEIYYSENGILDRFIPVELVELINLVMGKSPE